MAEAVRVINNMATFMCPECVKAKTIDVSKYKDSGIPVQVKCKCPCGHSFSVYLEKRKHPRKEVTLPGIYAYFMSGKEVFREQILVLNLSLSGMRFKLYEDRDVAVGDKYLVTFNLNDPNRSLIKKEVVVRNVNDLQIGAEFCSEDQFNEIEAYLEELKEKKGLIQDTQEEVAA